MAVDLGCSGTESKRKAPKAPAASDTESALNPGVSLGGLIEQAAFSGVQFPFDDLRNTRES